MRTVCFTTLALLAVGSFILPSKAVEPQGQSKETYVSAAELASKAAQTVGVGFQVPSSPGYKVLMIQRDKTGDIEVHTELNDTIIIERGRGEFLIGGRVTGNRLVQPNEWRGGNMSGAHKYAVSAGDLIMIPAGVPHKAVVTSGPFAYLTIKTPKYVQASQGR